MDTKDTHDSPENDPSAEPTEDTAASLSRREALQQALRSAAAVTAALLAASGASAQSGSKQEASSILGPLPGGQLPLVLKNVDLAAKTDAFYKELKGSDQLQSQFINNPTLVVSQRFLPPDIASRIPAQRISNANRLLYSVLANDGFTKWIQDYQADIEKKGKVDKAQIGRDFSAAVIRFGDAAFVQGLMEGTTGNAGPAAIDVCYVFDVLVAIEVVAVCIIIPVAVIGIVKRPGFSSADFRALAERMVARGRELDKSGALRTSFIG